MLRREAGPVSTFNDRSGPDVTPTQIGQVPPREGSELRGAPGREDSNG